jgi:hypothetical protein
VPTRRKRTTKRRKRSGHLSIRKSCRTCAHKPAQLRKNPSLHNHHGICSFKRYHKSYCSRRKCGCQNQFPKRKTIYAAYSRSKPPTRRKTSTAKRKYKLVDRKCNYTTALAQYRRGDITYTRLQKCKQKKKIYY